MTLNIIFPVLNEEIRLKNGIENTISFLKETYFYNDTTITIVDNGSTDKTEEISKDLCNEYPFLHYIKIKEKGVGVAFRKGAEISRSDIIGYMDVDLSTDIRNLEVMMDIFKNNSDIQIVNASRLNKESKVIGRKAFREFTSRVLNIILRIFLQVKATDAMCGFKFFRRDTLENLIKRSSAEKGWFFCAEILFRAERLHIPIYELPVVWTDEYHSTVHVFSLARTYMKQIFKLFYEFNIKKMV